MERWIKLRLHPDHRKVIALAKMMQVSANDALAMSIRWFRYMDADPKIAKEKFDPADVNRIVHAPTAVNFADAATRIGWFAMTANSTIRVRGYGAYLSDAARNMAYRTERKTPGKRRATPGQTRPDQTRTDQIDKTCQDERQDSFPSEAARQDLERAGIILHSFVAMKKRNVDRCWEMLKQLPAPGVFAANIKKVILQKKLQGDAAAGYFYNAVKSEAKP